MKTSAVVVAVLLLLSLNVAVLTAAAPGDSADEDGMVIDPASKRKLSLDDTGPTTKKAKAVTAVPLSKLDMFATRRAVFEMQRNDERGVPFTLWLQKARFFYDKNLIKN